MTYTPHTTTRGGSHIPGLYCVETGTFFEIDPLGQKAGFYSEAAAQGLSEAHARTATRQGIASIIHARAI